MKDKRKLNQGRRKSRLVLYSLIFIVFFAMFNLAWGYYRTESSKKPIVSEKLKAGDINFLYDFYISATPEIYDRPYYGYENASITFIVYIDFTEGSSDYFMDKIFPQLAQEFIYTGKIRYYHKNALSVDDYNSKTSNFIYAQALQCVYSLKKESYFDFYFDIFNVTQQEDLPALAGKYGILEDKFRECLEKSDFDEIRQDVSEVENYGLVGISPRFYIGITDTDNTIIDGIPSYQKLRRTIRRYQIQLGD